MMGYVLEPTSRQPKYRIVENRIRDQIISGEAAVGSMLPTEEALSISFGVSRATVRTALSNIQSEGLITRSPKIGSKVISATPRQQFHAGWASFEDLLQYTENVDFVILNSENITINNDLCHVTRFKPGRKIVRVNGLRKTHGNEDATCLLQIYFDVLYSGILEFVGQSKKPIAALIEENYRIRIMSIRQEISATILKPDEAATLGTSSGSAGLTIERWYTDTDNRVFEMSRAVYPAKSFRYVMDLGRSPNETK